MRHWHWSVNIRREMATRVLLLFLCLGAVKAQIDAVQLIDLVDPNRAVATPPMITAQPSERERPIEARRNVVLQCEGTGEPKPEFRWTKNGRFYDPSAVDDARVATQADKGTIIISRPKDSDEGLYQCIVQNPHGRAVSDKIYLRYATLGDFEKVENVPVHRVRIGDALTMKCVPPKGVPYPQIFWTIKTKTGLKQVELSDRISMDLEPGNLHFIYIKPEDMHEGGEYVCNAYNPHLNILKEGAYQGLEIINPSDPLPRQKPAMLYTTPINTVAWRGKELEMKCIFSGFPIPKFEWRRLDPNKLLPDGRYTYQSFGQSLILHDVQMEDAGEYECSARNGQGLPQKRKFTVQVLAEPYWIEKPESKHAGQGDTVTFMCLAGGKPEPIIRWYINGHPILEEQAPQTISNPNAVINYFYYTGDLTSEETGANKAQKLSDRWLINRNNFTIVDLRKEDDTMVIQCNASQQISDSYIFENAFLNVLSEAPVFRKEPYPLYEFVEGNVGEIHCDTFAAPRPTTRCYLLGRSRRRQPGLKQVELSDRNLDCDSSRGQPATFILHQA
ncbi:PREDICTED: neuronal cell adhesion molecule-like [Priapulus caudatus]|uniref:Neuronal cell adhesion molecule-like n=1 Tax=Priapulus caudatus TaxID=37621 RepID=A0ABM1DUI7_PRICU|nr:PREDICTED: neuronal cell adhesion molecule-like [Priapulus caudatus]